MRFKKDKSVTEKTYQDLLKHYGWDCLIDKKPTYYYWDNKINKQIKIKEKDKDKYPFLAVHCRNSQEFFDKRNEISRLAEKDYIQTWFENVETTLTKGQFEFCYNYAYTIIDGETFEEALKSTVELFEEFLTK